MMMEPFDFVQVVESRRPTLPGEKLDNVLLAEFLLPVGRGVLGRYAYKVLDNLYELLLMSLDVFRDFSFEG
jgi:hypothetical protein